jgi:hypothetical protein
MCVRSLIAQEWINRFAPNLACLLHENRKRFQKGKIVLSSSLGEGGCCSSETKHDRRKAPRAKLLVSDSRLQKQRSQPQQTYRGSFPDEDGFYSSETKHDRRTVSRPKLFVSARKLHKQRPQPYKSDLGLSPGEDGFSSS